MAMTEQQILEQLKSQGINVNALTELDSKTLDNASRGLGVENNLDLRVSVLEALKKQIQEGKLSVTDYSKKAGDLVKGTNDFLNLLTTKGSGPATMAKSYLSRLEPFMVTDNPLGGQGNFKDIKIPFSREEYSQLSEDVLPTEQDFSSGLISRTAVPFDRRQPTDGSGYDQNGIPVDIDLRSDRGKIELEGAREQQFSQEALDKRTADRKTALDELSTLLSDRADVNYQRAIPGTAENSNVAGVYRSTGFGSALAKEFAKQQQDVAYRLGEQGIRDRELNIAGAQDITDARVGAMQAALQRELSLDDFNRNRITALEFAEANKPKEQGKSSGEKTLQGIQAGVQLGGLVAAPFTGGASLAATGGASMIPTPGGASNSTSSSYTQVKPPTVGKGG